MRPPMAVDLMELCNAAVRHWSTVRCV